MAKTCNHLGCDNPVFSKLHCLRHQYIVKKPVRIRTVSKSRENKLKAYSTKRKEFLQKNHKCRAGLPGCSGKGTEIHHKSGRGKFLLDESTWMLVCRWCHGIIHNQMSLTDAIKKGLRTKRD